MYTLDAMIAVHQALSSDETLLRLLHYKPESFYDDPLSQDKPNIIDSDEQWDIIDDHIKNTPLVEDLTEKQIGRVIFYMGELYPGESNTESIDTRVVIDVFCHHSFQTTDYRLQKLIDHLIPKLTRYRLFRTDKETAEKIGVGEITFLGSEPLEVIPYYVGHRLTYTLSMENSRSKVSRRGRRYGS